MPKKIVDSNTLEDFRIDTIAEMLLQGCRSRDIKDYCRNTYKIQNRQIDNLIASAKIHIKNSVDYKTDIHFEKSKLLGRLEMLFNECYVSSDYKSCLNILKQQSELFNLNDIPETDITQFTPFRIEYTNFNVDDEKELAEYRKLKSQGKIPA